MKMLDGIMTTQGQTKLSYSELKLSAQDRVRWRQPHHHHRNLPTAEK